MKPFSEQNSSSAPNIDQTLLDLFTTAVENEEYVTAHDILDKSYHFIYDVVAQDPDSYKGFVKWMYKNGNESWSAFADEESESQSVSDSDEEEEELEEESEYDEEEELEEDLLSEHFQKKVTFQDEINEKEEVLSVDSGAESLGTVSTKSGRIKKGFVARITYEGGSKSPILQLIPSKWRLETDLGGERQGDHVTAYVLLLESLAHCRGTNVKELPEKFFKLASALLPDQAQEFQTRRDDVLAELERKRQVRKSVTKSLRKSKDLPADLKEIKDNLKKAETEAIARHVETISDVLMMKLNSLEKEAFPQDRKNGTRSYIVAGMKRLVDSCAIDFSTKQSLKSKIDSVSALEKTNLTQAEIKNIARKLKEEGFYTTITQGESYLKDLYSKNPTIEGLWQTVNVSLQDPRYDAFKLVLWTELDSLKTKVKGTLSNEDIKKIAEGSGFSEEQIALITPLKEYNEGTVINNIKTEIELLKTLDGEGKNIKLYEIGQNIAKLFDYPKVGKIDTQDPVTRKIERTDDEYVLYEAIPRHLILSFAAFNELSSLSATDKLFTINGFCDHVLRMQLWEGHIVKNQSGEDTILNKDLLLSRVCEFAQYDQATGEFSMKPQNEHPTKIYASGRIQEIPPSIISATSGQAATIPYRYK